MERGVKILRLFLLVCVLAGWNCSNIKGLTKPEAATTSGLIGEWVITEQTLTPLLLVPRCQPLLTGTTFTFTPQSLEVYLEASETPCQVYAYKISQHTISFLLADMAWICTYEITPNNLKITSDQFFTPTEPNQSMATQKIVVMLKKKS